MTAPPSNILKRAFSISVVVGGVVLTSLGIGYCSKSPESKTDCEFYRGYRPNKDGEMILSNTYAFDPLILDKRKTGQAKYPLEGDVSLENQLEKDKRYCFTFEEAKWPWSQRRLVSIRPDTSETE